MPHFGGVTAVSWHYESVPTDGGHFRCHPSWKITIPEEIFTLFQNKAAAYDWVNAIVDGVHIHEFNNADTWTSRI